MNADDNQNISIIRRVWRYPRSSLAPLVLAALVLCGCSTTPFSASHHFDFAKDSFSFQNELVWEYHYDANGKWVTNRRDPPGTYSQHCFVLARACLQFYENASFAPQLPVADERTYRRLVKQVISTNPRYPLAEDERIIIPGYSDLRTFSHAQEAILKAECGSGWESYFQRGHWRMIFPFSRREQQHMADQITNHLAKNRPAAVHVVRFPALTINHAVVIYNWKDTEDEIRFDTYDPNNCAAPVVITYNKSSRTFYLPANDYFPGGRIDVYQVYHRGNY